MAFQSVKELIEKRNKLVHDARQLAWADGVTADQLAQADALLNEASGLDAQIEERTRQDEAAARLQARVGEAEGRQVGGRQVPAASPVPRAGEAPAALSLQLGRHQLRLEPGSRAHALAQDDYRRRFASFLAGGPGDQLGLTTSDNKQGGYLAPMSMLSGLVKFLDDNVFIRQLATVLPPTSEKSVGILSYDADPADADWTAEVPAADIGEDSAMRFGKREMMPHLLSKLLKMSKKILRNATLDVEAYAVGRLGYKFGITEEKAFLTGSGAQQPLGLFTPSVDGISTGRDVSTGSATDLTYDAIVDGFYTLKEAYQQRATWLISREFLKKARKLKTSGSGEPIWTDNIAGSTLSASSPGLILGRPYRLSEYVPNTFTTAKYVAVCGDLSFYYIQDGLALTIERINELFTLRNQVGLLATKETDAMPVLEEAFVRFKTA